jgi:type VI protein secretion system component VasF
MISERDRRVLADIERQLRDTDPELCERLSGDSSAARRRMVDRLVSTRALLGGLAALAAAMLLGMSALAMVLFGVLVMALSVRIARVEVHLPDHPDYPPPFGMPPFGMPPYGSR